MSAQPTIDSIKQFETGLKYTPVLQIGSAAVAFAEGVHLGTPEYEPFKEPSNNQQAPSN